MMEVINPYGLFVGSFIPNWLAVRPEISPGAKLTYARLAQYAGKDGLAFPKTRLLANEIGCSYGAARKYLYELQQANLIVAAARWTEDGEQESNEYRFLRHEWMEYKGACPPSNTPLSLEEQPPCPPSDTGGVRRVAGIDEKNHVRRSRKRIIEEDQGFIAFYKLYPKKTHRYDALRAWTELKLPSQPALVNKIMDRLQTYIGVDWCATDPEYIPNPASWLRGHRWNDEVIHPGATLGSNGRVVNPGFVKDDYPGWDAEEFERKHVINSPLYQGKR